MKIISIFFLPFFIFSLIPFAYGQEESKIFVIDGFEIITNSDLVEDITLLWDTERLSEFAVNFSEPFSGQLEIQVPKNMPRTMNLDFETSLGIAKASLNGTYYEIPSNGYVLDRDFAPKDNKISEKSSLCHYVITVELSEEVDHILVRTTSVASGRWEPVTALDPLCGDFSLKQQLKNNFKVEDIQCINPSHILVERPNEKLACVYPETAKKLNWEIL